LQILGSIRLVFDEGLTVFFCQLELPGRCGFFRWLEQFKSIIAAKEKQLMQAHAAKEQDLKEVCPSTSGFQIRSSLCDKGKIDKLINLVQFLVLICIVIAVVMFFGVVVLLVK